MIEILELLVSGFWSFVGYYLILALIANLIANMWNRFWRHFNIRKHGYPPEHCDADGDFPELSKEDKTLLNRAKEVFQFTK